MDNSITNMKNRQRSHCVTKRSSLTEENHEEENKRKSIIIEDKFSNNKRVITRGISTYIRGINKMELKKPTYSGVKKSYPSGDSKNILFHDKAQLVGNLDKKNIGEILDQPQLIPFANFLMHFNQDELNDEVEIKDLIDIDHEELCELKDKAMEFIDATSMLIEEKSKLGHDTSTEESLVQFFMDKSLVLYLT